MAKNITETSRDFDTAPQVSVEFNLKPQNPSAPLSVADRLQAVTTISVTRSDGLPGRAESYTDDLSTLTAAQKNQLVTLLRGVVTRGRSAKGID